MNFFKRNKKKKPMVDFDPDETTWLCRKCKTFNRMSYRFCPMCGESRDRRPVWKDTGIVTEQNVVKDETLAYLDKIGLRHLADRVFTITVVIDGKKVAIELTGRQKSGDALEKLQELKHLPEGHYRFKDWPPAQPIIGPWYHHVSACVCELPARELHVEKYDIDDIVCLYGCPNVKSTDGLDLHGRLRLEVVDYGENGGLHVENIVLGSDPPL